MHEIVNNIKDKEDFLFFLKSLVDDFNRNKVSWENTDVESYLKAMMSWVEDMEQYYVNTNQPVPQNIDWKTFADILIASKMYE